jgi:hypothetical protein
LYFPHDYKSEEELDEEHEEDYVAVRKLFIPYH